MFLTEEMFLDYFRRGDESPLTRSQFIDEFTVMYSKPKTLRQLFSQIGKGNIIKSEEDRRYIMREEIIDYFYEIVVLNKKKYLSFFYNSYFKFMDPDDPKMKWDGVDLHLGVTKGGKGWKGTTTGEKEIEDLKIEGIISLQKNDESRRIIRNLFHLELLDLTRVTNTVKSNVSFWRGLVNLFAKLRLEDRFFAPSSTDLFLRAKDAGGINWNNLFYLYQAYQPKASIFNPYTICWILNHLAPAPAGGGGALFTPVLSWCSYLVAFMHCNRYKRYCGVDVMPSVCKKAEQLGDWYRGKSRKSKEVQIICSPSERLPISMFNEDFDTVLVCPPYYDMEIYPEGIQSIDTFKTYDSWLEGYWKGTVERCYKYCKNGGTFLMIANDYVSLTKDVFPLTADLSKIVTSCGFSHISTYYLQNRTSPLRVNSKDRAERLFVFKKEEHADKDVVAGTGHPVHMEKKKLVLRRKPAKKD